MAMVHRESLADQAARLLLARIHEGEWAVGERLPGETTLGPQLGVGRSTVREAIRQLAGRGVLSTRQGAGVFVAARDPRDDRDAVLQRAGIVAVLEARLAVESEAAALAAERRDAAQLAAIRDGLALRAAAGDGAEAHVDADMALHRAVVAASGNEVLLDLFDAFAPRSRAAMIDMLAMRPEPDPEADQGVHAALVEAVAARDPERARSVIRAHLRTLVDALGREGLGGGTRG